jgi:hypothetical protein
MFMVITFGILMMCHMMLLFFSAAHDDAWAGELSAWIPGNFHLIKKFSHSGQPTCSINFSPRGNFISVIVSNIVFREPSTLHEDFLRIFRFPFSCRMQVGLGKVSRFSFTFHSCSERIIGVIFGNFTRFLLHERSSLIVETAGSE